MESEDDQEQDLLAGLMVRFGTGTAAAQVAEKANGKVGEWACAPQAAALGYLVKFDADAARPLLERAIHSKKTGCSHSLFQDVSAYAWGPVLTDAAVGALEDTDSETVVDALFCLSGYGRKEDEGAVRERYSKWMEKWAGKAEILDSQDRETFQKTYQEVWVGTGLAKTLIASQGWLADDKAIASVVKNCVGKQMCEELKQVAALAVSPHRVTAYRSQGSENFQVGQYAVKSTALLGEKIDEYPKGTVFTLMPNYQHSPEQTELEKEAAGMLVEKGMKLVQDAP